MTKTSQTSILYLLPLTSDESHLLSSEPHLVELIDGVWHARIWATSRADALKIASILFGKHNLA